SCRVEDGIRDRIVTGGQTCALPILQKWPGLQASSVFRGNYTALFIFLQEKFRIFPLGCRYRHSGRPRRRIYLFRTRQHKKMRSEIGRAACRERVMKGGGRLGEKDTE